jgi:uncharacterized protein (DUF3084 family)
MAQLREDARLADIDQAIDETEKQIDAQLDLIERLECRGERTERSVDDFAALVDKLDKLAQQRMEILRALDQ